MGMDLALVLIGGEETYHPSRHHVAQVTEDAAGLIHLRKEDEGPYMGPQPKRLLALGLRTKYRPRVRGVRERGCGQMAPSGWESLDGAILPTKNTQLTVLGPGGICDTPQQCQHTTATPSQLPMSWGHWGVSTTETNRATRDVPPTLAPLPWQGPIEPNGKRTKVNEPFLMPGGVKKTYLAA